jgi:hypothetical protein
VNTYAVAPQEPLPQPYATRPSPEGLEITPAVLELARNEVRTLLQSSRAFGEMSPLQRKRLAHDLVKVSAYTAALMQEQFALSEQLDQVPMLVRQTVDPYASAAETGVPAGAPAPLAQAAANAPAPPPPPAAEEWSPRAANQVAKVTRATLNAIEFPKFVADLIKGTYQAIVDSSIKQMEAYAELISNVAKTVKDFENDNITDNQARDYLVSTYPGHFKVQSDDTGAKVVVAPGADQKPAPNFQNDLGLTEDVQVSDTDAEEKLVPAARRKLAENRHQLLSTMVMMGVNRIVVTSGHIRAGLTFRIDAHDHATASTASEFDEQNTTVAGSWFGFGGAATANSLTYVSTSKRDSTDDLDVHADLTGEVDLKFKSDYLPLERMATPQMMGAIQGNTPNPAANTPMSGGGTKQPAATGQ